MAVTVVGVTVVGGFIVGDAHLVGFTDPVDPVYPPGFIKSICGPVICGDGHLCLGQPSGQFGAVTWTISMAQTKAVTGLTSAQQFGVVKTAFGINVTGVSSAQQFGTVRFRVSAPTLGLDTAQQFGVPTPKAVVTRAIAGLGSAQQFGAVRASVPIKVTGLDSAQQFGVPTTRFTVQVTGLDTAQQFGIATIPQKLTVPGLDSEQQFGTPETGMVVYRVYLWPEVCVSSPDPAICGYDPQSSIPTICGDGHVCGGMGWLDADVVSTPVVLTPSAYVTDSFLTATTCVSETQQPPIVNTFFCGQRLVGGLAFLLPEAPSYVLDLTPAGVS